jgi:hypothetical protein
MVETQILMKRCLDFKLFYFAQLFFTIDTKYDFF